MNTQCPVCGTTLRQLGEMTDAPGNQRVWRGENLYQCPECKWPDKNYTILAGRPMLS